MAFSMAWLDDAVQDGPGRERARGLLTAFRGELYRCLARRADALSEVADAVLCKPDRVHMLAEVSLEAECRRGHGAVYDALNCGRVDLARLRWALAALPLPAWADGRIRLAVDVSSWLRPDAQTSPERLFCHCHGRGKGNAVMVPGWPYSVVAALSPGRTSWTRLLDAVRPGPADDATAVTAAQIRQVVRDLIAAGHWRDGDPAVIVIFDAGYDLTRLAWLLADLPVEVLGRLRSDRVMYFRAVPRTGSGGRPARHGAALRFTAPRTWPGAAVTTITTTTRYGTATAMAWGPVHQKLKSTRGWEGHDGELPLVEGIVIRLAVDHLPGSRDAEPIWLRTTAAALDPGTVNRSWQAFLRRFDLEHTFRFLKQTLGWTRPRLRDPAAADRWTWLILACYTQLWLARDLAEDLRLPWQQPCPPGRLTPARVRRGFRDIRQTLPALASAPKPGKPGPGRPPGTKTGGPPPATTPGKPSNRKTRQENPQPDRLNNKFNPSSATIYCSTS